jgi:UDP-N-acetylmuramate--alanine ligase
MPGDHHVRNALAAVAVGLELDIPITWIREGIELFQGVGRRFEIKGVYSGVTLVDDYAHHPTEIAATIGAAVSNFGRRVIVFFQPHRYTRTQAIADRFAGCFEGACMVIVTDIYAAGEKPIAGITAQTIVSRIKRNGGVPVIYAPTFAGMVTEAIKILKSGDIVITMGAGDIYKAGELLAAKLEKEKS